MFSAYFDASGNHLDPSMMFVSGFISDVGRWGLFQKEWFGLLDAHGLENPFHMTDFMAAKEGSKYEPWKGRWMDFLTPALTLINYRTNKDFSQGLVVKDYDRMHREFITESHALLGKTIRTPLAYCGCAMGISVREWARRQRRKGRKIDGEIEYVFDRGDKHKGQLAEAYREAFNIEPLFRDKKEVAGIQAADILAWCHRKGVSDLRKKKPMAPPLFLDLAHHLPGFGEWVYADWPKLEGYCLEQGLARRVLDA